MKKIVTCNTCGVDFEKYFNSKSNKPPSKRNYCCMKCKKEDKLSYCSEWTEERRKLLSEQSRGENNPNYGHRWGEEQKSRQSAYIIQKYKDNPDLAFECGKSNRGVKFSQERILAMHGHRTRESYQKTHSEETKKLIGLRSAEKFTEEYKMNHRKKMEESGYWIPLENQDPYILYYKESGWFGAVLEFITEEEGILLNTIGLKSQTNPTGIVRDHIFSRREGWNLQVNHKILRHPCNLQLLTNAENVRKGHVDRKLLTEESEIKLQSLLSKILIFDKNWVEHQEVLDIIRETYEYN